MCTWARSTRAVPLWREGPCSPGASVQEEGCGTAHLRPRVSFSGCTWKPAVTETALPAHKIVLWGFLAGKRGDTGIILWINCRNISLGVLFSSACDWMLKPVRTGMDSSFHVFFTPRSPPPSPPLTLQGQKRLGTRWVLFPSRMGLFQLHFTAFPEDSINISRRMQIRGGKKDRM